MNSSISAVWAANAKLKMNGKKPRMFQFPGLLVMLSDAKKMKKKSVQVVIGDNPIYLTFDPDEQD